MNSSWIRLVHRLLTVVIALHNGIRAISRDAIDHIHWGYKLDGKNLGTFYDVTLGQCHEKCYVRSLCTAYNYHRLHRKCNLTLDNSETATRSPGWIYNKKADWTNKYSHPGCSGCAGECIVGDDNEPKCHPVDWCDTPTLLNPKSYIEGNVYSLGSKVKHVCTDDPTIHVISKCLTGGNWSQELLECNTGAESTSTCLPTGPWNVTSFACWKPVGNQLDDKNRTIFNPSLNKTWDYGNGDLRISVKNEGYNQVFDFIFTYNTNDSSYSLNVNSNDNDGFICDGYGLSNYSSLHTQSHCPNADRKRFFIYEDPSSSMYLIKSKMNGRFVRIDEDELVSTKCNLTDDRAKFNIIP